jgi:hypothetical protein
LVVWGKLWVFPDILFNEFDLSCDVGELVEGRLNKPEAVNFLL